MEGELKIKRDLRDLSTNYNDYTLLHLNSNKLKKKKKKIGKIWTVTAHLRASISYWVIDVFRFNNGIQVRFLKVFVFLVIYTKIFSDEMMWCQKFAQNYLDHGEAGDGTDKIRISH